MINHRYEPSEVEDRILELLKDNEQLRQKTIAEEMGESSSVVNYYIHRLVAAGWVYVPDDYRGVYRLRCDPREMSNAELANLYRETIGELQ
jgi:Mn-dependent DtxR family transcriptional regulator